MVIAVIILVLVSPLVFVGACVLEEEDLRHNRGMRRRGGYMVHYSSSTSTAHIPEGSLSHFRWESSSYSESLWNMERTLCDKLWWPC